MRIEKLAAIGEIVSSVAIVATLGYLAVQTKQTNNALIANSRQAVLEAEQSFFDRLIEHPELIQLGNEGTETIEETTRIFAHVLGYLRSREFLWMQYEFGVIDEATMNSYLGASVVYIDRPSNLEIWHIQKQFFDPDFVEHFDMLLEQ